MKIKIVIIATCLLSWHNPLNAQVTQEKIERIVNSKQLSETIGISQQQKLRELYASTNYSGLWIKASGQSNRSGLIQLLDNAANEGLNKEDYQYEFISSFSNEKLASGNSSDSLEAELKFSDAAIHFFSELVYGNISPVFGYDGLNYSAAGYDIPKLIAKYGVVDQVSALFDYLATLSPEVRAIRKHLALLNALAGNGVYKDEKIVSSQVSHLNKPLLQKLYLLGISDSIDKRSAIQIKECVKGAQYQFNLLADGVLRTTTVTELNVPIEIRMQQLRLAINYYRWLFCLSQQQPVIVVNIPAACLKVYSPENILLEMKMIVGKPSTPTPALTSQVTEVILYPYWKVPYSIATKELLPAIKRNPGFIDANNFQVISNAGKIMDPYKINWQELSRSNFPYTIRQSTGCDNALGLIKLNFYNPVGVYLHDTPDKSLFLLNKRYFSHGCMRMEKPMELGHLILKNNGISIDTLEEKGCLRNQSPITVQADVKMPVVVWYNPVGTDGTGKVIYYEDVYKKFSRKEAFAFDNKNRH